MHLIPPCTFFFADAQVYCLWSFVSSVLTSWSTWVLYKSSYYFFQFIFIKLISFVNFHLWFVDIQDFKVYCLFSVQICWNWKKGHMWAVVSHQFTYNTVGPRMPSTATEQSVRQDQNYFKIQFNNSVMIRIIMHFFLAMFFVHCFVWKKSKNDINKLTQSRHDYLLWQTA